tara:strand:+ start:5292 stop:5567 length:276 start_codon:yes stop_codon:yes gene_type:complete
MFRPPMNPAYLQMLQQKGMMTQQPKQITNINRGGLSFDTGQQQVPIRQQGFGTHFKDSPPEFIAHEKIDNKIERMNKPKPKKKRKSKRKSK